MIIEAGGTREAKCNLFKRSDLDEILIDVAVLVSSDPVDDFSLEVVVPHLHVESDFIFLRLVCVVVDDAYGRFVVQQTERGVKVLIGRQLSCAAARC